VAPGKKNAARLGAHLAFVDESGFLLIPTVRKTWAPRGMTPVCRHPFRREKVSAISAVTVSPQKKRVGRSFCLQETNFRCIDVATFLSEDSSAARDFPFFALVVALFTQASITVDCWSFLGKIKEALKQPKAHVR
jgi:hypothetical protein